MARIKKVLTRRTEYTKITIPGDLLLYIIACIAAGIESTLFQNPKILTAYYTAGTAAKTALSDAIDNYTLFPIKANMDIVLDKMALVIIWLDGYSDQVETISNLPANRTTREEAATNITISHLSPQKLVSSSKGDPDTPVFTAKNNGDGVIGMEVTNGTAYKPSNIVFVAVEIPFNADKFVPPAVVSIVDGQVIVQCSVGVITSLLTLSGKGKKPQFKTLKTGVSFAIYAYAMNGNDQISGLSAPVTVRM
ncbi:MAG: hypothetical protein WCL14_12615 [Bacteroidota bacterium]